METRLDSMLEERGEATRKEESAEYVQTKAQNSAAVQLLEVAKNQLNKSRGWPSRATVVCQCSRMLTGDADGLCDKRVKLAQQRLGRIRHVCVCCGECMRGAGAWMAFDSPRLSGRFYNPKSNWAEEVVEYRVHGRGSRAWELASFSSGTACFAAASSRRFHYAAESRGA